MKSRPANSLFECPVKPLRQKGFTLFEMLIVLLIVSIFTMLGWPVLSSVMADYRLEAAAEEIVNALEFAQLTATNGQTTEVSVSATAKRIDVRQFTPIANLLDGSSQYPAADVEGGNYAYLGNPMNKGVDYSIVFPNDSRFGGVDIKASDFGSVPVTFDSTGTPSKGGTVTLAIGDRRKVITLDALTGSVSVSG